jgi:hypothetical protein
MFLIYTFFWAKPRAPTFAMTVASFPARVSLVALASGSRLEDPRYPAIAIAFPRSATLISMELLNLPRTPVIKL